MRAAKFDQRSPDVEIEAASRCGAGSPSDERRTGGRSRAAMTPVRAAAPWRGAGAEEPASPDPAEPAMAGAPPGKHLTPATSNLLAHKSQTHVSRFVRRQKLARG